MKTDQLFENIEKAGWSPYHLGAEARRALRLPWLPAHLSASDRVGILWLYCNEQYLRRFMRARGTTRSASIAQLLRFCAMIHIVIAHTSTKRTHDTKVQFTLEDIGELCAAGDSWRAKVLSPSLERIEAAFNDGTDLRTDPERYEPALTYIAIRHEHWHAEIRESLAQYARGLAMHE